MKKIIFMAVVLAAFSVRADSLEGVIVQVRTNGIHFLVNIPQTFSPGQVVFPPQSRERVFVEGYTNEAAAQARTERAGRGGARRAR